MTEKVKSKFFWFAKLFFKIIARTAFSIPAVIFIILWISSYGFSMKYFYDIETTLDYRQGVSDLAHKNANNDCIVGNTLFYPIFEKKDIIRYDRKIPFISRRLYEINTYSLVCEAIQEMDTKEKATINFVIVEPVADVNFEKIVYDEIIPLDSTTKLNGAVGSQYYRKKILNPISEDDLCLTNSSVIKITMNVTVGDGESAITKDLQFECKANGHLMFLGVFGQTH